MASNIDQVRRGIYNVEYFSGAQVSLYIGDVWVDEVTTLSYSVMQNRRPLYGYASQLFDDVSEGQVIVQGQFTINFKEAGYLWLILNRYREKIRGQNNLLNQRGPFQDSSSTNKQTIERIINNETNTFERNQLLQNLAAAGQQGLHEASRLEARASLGGFASQTRGAASVVPVLSQRVGLAENLFEQFEDAVWGRVPSDLDMIEHRRADDSELNPFDMYATFGDFAGDGTANHTIERIKDVYILGKSKQIVIDGMPIQEQYQFFARNQI